MTANELNNRWRRHRCRKIVSLGDLINLLLPFYIRATIFIRINHSYTSDCVSSSPFFFFIEELTVQHRCLWILYRNIWIFQIKALHRTGILNQKIFFNNEKNSSAPWNTLTFSPSLNKITENFLFFFYREVFYQTCYIIRRLPPWKRK